MELTEAKTTAEDLHEELCFKHRNNHPLKSKTFKHLADDYLRKADHDTVEGWLSKGRLGLVEGTLRRYLLPFFGNRAIGGITQADFNEYDDWRLSYWASGAGAEQRTANAAVIPAAKALPDAPKGTVPFLRGTAPFANSWSYFSLQSWP